MYLNGSRYYYYNTYHLITAHVRAYTAGLCFIFQRERVLYFYILIIWLQYIYIPIHFWIRPICIQDDSLIMLSHVWWICSNFWNFKYTLYIRSYFKIPFIHFYTIWRSVLWWYKLNYLNYQLSWTIIQSF